MNDSIRKLNPAGFPGMAPVTQERNDAARLFPARMVSWTEA
jgi:hypothetical protein